MILKDFLYSLRAVGYDGSGAQVFKTVHEELETFTGTKLNNDPAAQNCLKLSVFPDGASGIHQIPKEREWAYFKINDDGSGRLTVSKPFLLFSTVSYLTGYCLDSSVDEYKNGKLITAAFTWNRPEFDYCLTQFRRNARNFDWKSHIREYARIGCSHIEVNSLATPHGMEPLIPGETYSVFYTYCACPDQFVHSKLNKGFYPAEYLSANLSLLKKYANEALKYGLTPGIHCFEPRNVPDALLEKYPTLRGARTDHPFRSWKPRFNLSLAHPFVRMHYKELIQNLLKEVPEIGYMSIVTNDSGAGFEYTRSLYVGANGGAYLIREWKTVEEVAKAAGENVHRFLKLLRDSASQINPDFRVMFRLDPFAAEYDFILDKIGERMDVVGASFLHRGYFASYTHEKYDDVKTVQATLWQTTFKQEEKKLLDKLKQKGSTGQAIYSGGVSDFDPLLGIPAPWMHYSKLKAYYDTETTHIAQTGGLNPKSLAPWCINREITGLFQHNPSLDIDQTLQTVAGKWVGAEYANDLIEAWKKIEVPIRNYPPAFLYPQWGITWYRLWYRPIIPDIERIPEDGREYYERFMLATRHNPARIDLNQDVLFELGGPDLAGKLVERTDKNVLPEIRKAIEYLASLVQKSASDPQASAVFTDLYDRIRGLECWFITQRNVQAWIAGVHGYLKTDNAKKKAGCKTLLKGMVLSEIENMKNLLNLYENSTTDFMVISAQGESVHILGDNFAENVRRKITLMEGHENDDPNVDPNFMWRVPEIDFYSLDDIDV